MNALPESDLVYFQGTRATNSRPITRAEHDRLRRQGLSMRRRFWQIMVAVTVYLVAIESSIQIASWLELLWCAPALATILWAVWRVLLPARRCLSLPEDAKVITLGRQRPLVSQPNPPSEVTAPGGIPLTDPARPLNLVNVAPPPQAPLENSPTQSYRQLTAAEQWELARHRRTEQAIKIPILCLAIVGFASTAGPYLLSGEASARLHVPIAAALYCAILFPVLRSKRPKQIRTEIRGPTGSPRWIEFLGDSNVEWTIDGEPADWRKR